MTINEPLLMCLPIQRSLIVLSIFGIFASLLTVGFERYVAAGSIFSFLFYCFLLYGTIRCNVSILNWSRKLIYLFLVIHVALQFFLPVVITSSMASNPKGMLGPKEHQQRNQFWLGVMAGMATQMFIMLSAGVMYLKYVMVKRLYVFAVGRRQIEMEEMTI